MVKIEAVIHPFKRDEVKNALEQLDCGRIGFTELFLNGGPEHSKVWYRGCEYARDVERIKVEMLVTDQCVDEIVNALAEAARTGSESDDGTILAYEVRDVVQLGNGRLHVPIAAPAFR